MHEVRVVSLVVLAFLVGCGSVSGGATGKDAGGTGGTGGGSIDAGLGGSGGQAGEGGHAVADAQADQGSSAGSDGAADVDSDGATCPGATTSDPFAGVWTDTVNNETWTVTNNGGCSTWVGEMAGSICDYCAGTYTTTGTTTAVLMLSCMPRSSCSVSPTHSDTGSMTLSGCSFTYAYNYGGGSASQTVTKTSGTTINVCGSIDAGGN